MAYIHKKHFEPVCLFGPAHLLILTVFPTSTLIWSSTSIRNRRVGTLDAKISKIEHNFQWSKTNEIFRSKRKSWLVSFNFSKESFYKILEY